MESAVDELLDRLLCFEVDGRRRLVENHDLTLAENRPTDADESLFARAEVFTAAFNRKLQQIVLVDALLNFIALVGGLVGGLFLTLLILHFLLLFTLLLLLLLLFLLLLTLLK